jgi:hypothetical protein
MYGIIFKPKKEPTIEPIETGIAIPQLTMPVK